MNLESLKDAYIHLNEVERTAFAEFVLTDYSNGEYAMTPEEIAEIERRMEDVHSGRVKTLSGEEVESYIRQKHGF